MTMRKRKFKTDAEELEYYKTQLVQIEKKAEREKRMVKKPNSARSVRTHRLIEKGALAEKFFGNEGTAEEFQGFLCGLVALPGVKEYIDDNAVKERY